MRKTVFTWMVGILLVMCVCGCSSQKGGNEGGSSNVTSDKSESYKISFGAGSSSGSAYVVAVAYSDIINTELDNVVLTVEETGGGYEVIDQMMNGEMDMILCAENVAQDALNHRGRFEGTSGDSSCVAAFSPFYYSGIQAIVKSNSPIQCYSDFEGKRVGVDLIGTGSEAIHGDLFKLFGLEGKFTAVNANKSEMMQMLKTGELDVAIITTGIPTSTVSEFGTTEDFRIIPLSKEEQELAVENLGYCTAGNLSRELYDDLTEDVPSLIIYNTSYVSTAIDEDTVYAMTKAIWENRERLEAAHPTQKDVTPETLKRVTSPFHPGAERYYREQGWLD